ncbi:MAG: hypothetical protein AYP45_08025 [Candidatus Brocadia carolinensis]|uniref:Uncharacterized protein n=1 Tax=Candidatus Brocadia carolinensis TaxID=1004156 RepID=A0A1V4AU31_9BACT|nr:MAG: hypothetical protein AYP45_08025 [Candidatus Brocadia caroliniensis]
MYFLLQPISNIFDRAERLLFNPLLLKRGLDCGCLTRCFALHMSFTAHTQRHKYVFILYNKDKLLSLRLCLCVSVVKRVPVCS